jgi:hypothetical protein
MKGGAMSASRKEKRRELAAILGQFCDSLEKSLRQLDEAFAAAISRKDRDDA